MDEQDFQEYLAKYGCKEDEEGMSEEENCQLEAELYSRVHYEMKPENDPEITDNVSLDLFQEIVKNSNESSKSCKLKNSELRIDSGVSSPLPTEDTRYEPTKFLKTNCLENILQSPEYEPTNPSPKYIEETKYVPTIPKNMSENSHKKVEFISSDSEDDSGIQVLNEFSKNNSDSKKSCAANLIDLAVESSECESDVEHLPYFRNLKSSNEKLVVEKEETSDAVKDIKKIKIQRSHLDSSDSDSSIQEIGSDGDDQMIEDGGDLQLNLKGQKCHNGNERTFKQIIGSDETILDLDLESDSSEAELPTKSESKRWNEDMEKFYNEVDPELADITIEKIWDKLPNDADWSVKKPHDTPSRNSRNRYFQGRHCTNCNKDGHNMKSCPEPKRRKVCFMCCEEGHLHFQCPKQHCLRCGAENEPYSENCRKCRYLDTMDCRLCGGRGHIQSHCPDTWRRFHASTSAKAGLFVPDINVHLPAHQAWCCNCARQGHYVHQCRAYSYSSIPPLVLSVVSYKEPQQFRHHTQTTTPSESKSVKKRRLREEMRASRRAYLSLPSTPKNRPPHQDEFHSQSETPKSVWNKNRTNFVLQGTKGTLEEMIESKKQRRKEKKVKKKMKSPMYEPTKFKSFLSENLEDLIESKKQSKKEKKMEKRMKKNMSESAEVANFSLVNLMKEKLAKSKHKEDSRPELSKVRRKVMKELHFMKRHSLATVGTKKRKKLNNLLSIL